MCNFFSFCSDGNGKCFYFNWEQREALLKNNSNDYNPDSHTSIAHANGFIGKKEDMLNKYEFNPFTKFFQIDKLNTVDDSKNCRTWIEMLDFKTIIEPLIIKPIIHPLNIAPDLCKNGEPHKKDIDLLKQWASVWDSVGASVWDSVWVSVRDSVKDSVGASVGASVWDSVGASVWDSVRDSFRALVGASVRDSVRALVGASVRAYISSFFSIKYKYDFSSAIQLWQRGFVPSFDDKTWRLHCGKNAKIVYEMKAK